MVMIVSDPVKDGVICRGRELNVTNRTDFRRKTLMVSVWEDYCEDSDESKVYGDYSTYSLL